jgi:Spy/CpxP family protein refolding chaperone
MKLTPKILGITSGVIVAGGLSAVAFAHPPGLPGMRMLSMAQRLDLSEEQEVAAVRMRRAIREEAQQNREEMKAAFDEVLKELEKPNPDPAKMHRLVDDASARMTKVAHSSVDKYLEFHRTLTPEQRKELVASAKEMKEHRKEFRKRFKHK